MEPSTQMLRCIANGRAVRLRLQLRVCLVAAAWLVPVAQSGAVVTIINGYTGVRTLVMRIGTAAPGSIDTVQFDVGGVSGNSQVFSPTVNGNGVAIAASTGAVPISMNMRVPSGNLVQAFSMTVTSPTALTCVSGGCGASTIPFSAISWTVTTAPTGANANFDFQNGTFVGGTTQSLNNFPIGTTTTLGFAAQVTFSNTLNFQYANTTAFPAGNYSGTVVYTATLL